MPLKAAPVGLVRVVLSQADPSGETAFWFRPPNGYDDMARGEMLKGRSYTYDPIADQTVTRIEVNMPQLHSEEMWMLYDHAECIIESGHEPNVKREEPFKPRKEMTRQEFFDGLSILPELARKELWVKMVSEVAPGWGNPF